MRAEQCDETELQQGPEAEQSEKPGPPAYAECQRLADNGAGQSQAAAHSEPEDGSCTGVSIRFMPTQPSADHGQRWQVHSSTRSSSAPAVRLRMALHRNLTSGFPHDAHVVCQPVVRHGALPGEQKDVHEGRECHKYEAPSPKVLFQEGY